MERKLLEILACPVCRGPVSEERETLVCGGCGRGYPVREGIPIMLEDEALLPRTPNADGPERS